MFRKCMCGKLRWFDKKYVFNKDFRKSTMMTNPNVQYMTWASSWQNVSSGVSDQVRLKLTCSATETS